jgi:hypothetical protein
VTSAATEPVPRDRLWLSVASSCSPIPSLAYLALAKSVIAVEMGAAPLQVKRGDGSGVRSPRLRR